MPLVGSSRMITFGCGRQPFGDDDLLLVAARQRADILAERGGAQVEPLGVGAGQRELLRQLAASRTCDVRLQRGQRDVLEDRQADHDALLAALLRHVDDAGIDRIGRRRRRDRLAFERDRAARWCGSCRRSPASPRCARRRRGRRSRGSRRGAARSEMSSNSVGCDRPATASTGAPIVGLALRERCGRPRGRPSCARSRLWPASLISPSPTISPSRNTV